MKETAMKRFVNRNEEILEISVVIHFYKDDIAAASVLDISDPAFQSFELDVLEAFDIHRFELIEESNSSVPGSVSHYYTFVKTNEEGTKLKVYLKLRISDHQIGDDNRRNIPKYAKRDQDFVNRRAREYAQENFNQPRGYRARRIDIVLNDENYTSYESALRAIEDKLDDFDPE